jgi:hypothetical protein
MLIAAKYVKTRSLIYLLRRSLALIIAKQRIVIMGKSNITQPINPSSVNQPVKKTFKNKNHEIIWFQYLLQYNIRYYHLGYY